MFFRVRKCFVFIFPIGGSIVINQKNVKINSQNRFGINFSGEPYGNEHSIFSDKFANFLLTLLDILHRKQICFLFFL